MPAAKPAAPVNPVPPDWSTVAEDVFCPLCDYNLRGLIEPRCPECGFRFDWPDLLDPARRRHPFLFEHHPERNWSSFWKTTFATLRPARFWRTLHPAQPSRPLRLILFWFISTSSLLFGIAGMTTSFVALQFRLAAASRASWATFAAKPALSTRPAFKSNVQKYGSVQAYVNAMSPQPTLAQTLRTACATLWSPRSGAIRLPLSVIAWTWLTYLSLMVFKTSMDRARVKNVHVLRAVIYSATPVIGFGAAAFVAISVGIPFLASLGPIADVLLLAAAGLLFAGVVLSMRGLAVAYRHYLQFDRPGWTVAAAQTIALLTIVTALVFLEVST